MPAAPSPVPLPLAVVLVGIGGAAGASLRWALESAAPWTPHAFPWTTFGINVTGSFVLALLPTLVAELGRGSAWLVPLLGPGLLGGYTTLSATSEQARVLIDGEHSVLASAYLTGTVAAALTAVAAAGWLASRLGGHRGSPR